MYDLTIITLEETVFSGQVHSLIAPGELGYLEILSHHAPIITLIQKGKVDIVTEDSRKLAYTISGGFMEVSNNVATLFADSINLLSDEPQEVVENNA